MNFSETAFVDGTLYTLGLFSLLTWSVILLKAGEIAWHRYRNRQLIKSLRGDVSLNSVSSLVKQQRKPLAIQAGRILTVGHQTYVRAQSQPSYEKADHAAWHELIERTLRQQLQKEKALLDSGLGWLASIGSTAPFIGLFGTVWGIMHALKDIGVQGSASLEVVAGPIGEALIATA